MGDNVKNSCVFRYISVSYSMKPEKEGTDVSYVYILRCADGTLYTGSTTDLDRRLAAHNSGKGAKYTRSRRPVEMVYHEERADWSDALRREAEIKKLTRKEKLALIERAEGGTAAVKNALPRVFT